MSDSPHYRGLGIRRTLLPLCLLLCAIPLSACGLGALDDEASSALIHGVDGAGSLHITTTSVPVGSSGVDYGPATLTAAGARGPVSWRVASGSLPPGLTLTSAGRVLGTPVATGFFQFSAEAEDDTSSDRRDFAISVDTFGLTVIEGRRFGDAWSGVPVVLRCVGFPGSVSFQVVSSDSGGSLTQVDTAAGTAIWIPGQASARGSLDVIRADCDATGSSAEVILDVAPDTTTDHVARFGSTDVWYLDFEIKRGAHPYASDWHAGLARLGLRAPAGTPSGEADRLAEFATRVATLRHINRMFLRDADGGGGARGLAISFALERPGAGYATPVPGGVTAARGNLYSVMGVCDQGGSTFAYGTAFQDDLGNPRVENDSPGAAGALGTFVNYVAEAVQNVYRQYGADLRDEPVNEDDIEALKAILYGRPSPGGRYEMLRYFVEALAENVAFIAAHESAHSLGVGHTSTYTHGSIMNTMGVISPGAEHFFLEEDLARLRLGLPGPGRGSAAQKIDAELVGAMAAVHVCDGHCAGG